MRHTHIFLRIIHRDININNVVLHIAAHHGRIHLNMHIQHDTSKHLEILFVDNLTETGVHPAEGLPERAGAAVFCCLAVCSMQCADDDKCGIHANRCATQPGRRGETLALFERDLWGFGGLRNTKGQKLGESCRDILTSPNHKNCTISSAHPDVGSGPHYRR